MAHRTNIFFTGRDARAWGLFVLRGCVFALLGAYALVRPAPHAAQAVAALGLFWLFDGASLLAGWMSGPLRDVRFALLRGLVCLAAGLVLLLNADLGLLSNPAVLPFAAATSLLTGLMELGSALLGWHKLEGRWALTFGGLTFLLLGGLLWQPVAGRVQWLAYVALGGGGLVLLQGLSLRKKLLR